MLGGSLLIIDLFYHIQRLVKVVTQLAIFIGSLKQLQVGSMQLYNNIIKGSIFDYLERFPDTSIAFNLPFHPILDAFVFNEFIFKVLQFELIIPHLLLKSENTWVSLEGGQVNDFKITTYFIFFLCNLQSFLFVTIPTKKFTLESNGKHHQRSLIYPKFNNCDSTSLKKLGFILQQIPFDLESPLI